MNALEDFLNLSISNDCSVDHLLKIFDSLGCMLRASKRVAGTGATILKNKLYILF